MKIQQIAPLKNDYLESIGFAWHSDIDGSRYVPGELVEVSSEECERYYEAANELYDMFVAAAQHVIDNNLFHELGIPYNLVNLIKASWENDVHWHLYGRFDFAGGIDGKPIKLLEFNADTPTAVFETAILQWAMLKQNGLDESAQFNDLFDGLVENFKRLLTLDDDTSGFEDMLAQNDFKILFTCLEGSIEDEQTTRLLQAAATHAGYKTRFAYIHEIAFDDENGVFMEGENYEFLFKLIPWESIAIEEGELALRLENIIANQKAIILNPAYTLLFQSKGIMKILWDLYPNHPLLLESSYEPLSNKTCVKKPFLAREGANVSVLGANGEILAQNDGEYGNQKFLYQEYTELPQDAKGQKYQAGVFFAFEGCALGFRKGGEIIDNYSKFVGHIIV